jgi:hypothetical protein
MNLLIDICFPLMVVLTDELDRIQTCPQIMFGIGASVKRRKRK